MIHFDPALTLDSTTLIMAALVIIVFALHFYMQRLIAKQPRTVSRAAIPSSETQRVKPVAGKRDAKTGH